MKTARYSQTCWAIALPVFVCLFSLPTCAQYGGGTGEPNDPYLIYTAEHLNAIGAEPNDWDKHFQLMADIDLSAYDGREGRLRFNVIGGTVPRASGSSLRLTASENGFTGVFDGNGHVVANFSYVATDENRVGLFGHLRGPDVRIRDLRLVDPNVDAGWALWVGALVGFLEEGTLTNCHVLGGRVSGYDCVAGLVGYSVNGTIDACHSTATITGAARTGGLVGCNRVAVVSRSCAGGAVTGGFQTGGLIGANGGSRTLLDEKPIVIDCYSIATVVGSDCVGGLVGDHADGGSIANCYASGLVAGNAHKGGLVGSNHCDDITACFWDMETSGQATSAAGTGKTTAEMQTVATFIGWSGDIWTVDEAKDYPRLWWEDRAGEAMEWDDIPIQTGAPSTPFLISSADELLLLGAMPFKWDKHFELTADIDLSDIDANDYVPIEKFAGTFNGNGHAIANFTYTNTGDNAGFFRLVDLTGVVRDLHMRDAVVSGSRYVGALAGHNVGNIEGCSVTGTVKGVSDVGGLVGRNPGRIKACTAEAEVTGESSVGGLVGDNVGGIEACFSAGRVVGQASVGGLVGWNDADIVASYSTADVVGDTQVGGLVGTAGEAGYWNRCPAPPPMFVPYFSESRVTACYSAGRASGTREIGGLIGNNAGIVMGCYAAGPVQVLPSEGEEDSGERLIRDLQGQAVFQMIPEPYAGGLIGLNEYGIVHSSYWDTQACGLLESRGGRGKTTPQMLSGETFEGWGFFGVWVMDSGGDYPRLAWTDSPGAPIVDDPLRYSAGTGSAEDPYEIWTSEEFARIGRHPSDWNKHFVLMNDLDCSGVDANSIRPIGTRSVPFTGTFDGNGHAIANYTYHAERELYVGPFACIGPTSGPDANIPAVSGLHMANVDISGFCQVGGLAAYSEGAISSCSVAGRVAAANKNVGGLVGYSLGALKDCSTDCTITGAYVTGALAGYAGGPVTGCSGAGIVASTNDRYSYAGGLIGESSDIVLSSHFTGNVSGGYTAGGFVALNQGTISQCWAKATVTGSYLVGGLVGYNDYSAIIRGSSAEAVVGGGNSAGGLAGYNGGTIRDCHAAGQVSGETRVAGLVGQCYRDLMSCYSTCAVSGQSLVGGVVGDLSAWGSVTACFWDLDVCAIEVGVAEADAEPNHVLGLTTAQMRTAGTFLDAGWDFVGEVENGTEDIWHMPERDYPRLVWELAIDGPFQREQE